MNNKLLNYEDAIKLLKKEETLQRIRKAKFKLWKRTGKDVEASFIQSVIKKEKYNINLILSLISAHKESRRLFGKLKDKSNE